jgi:hypothetical protein
VDCRRSQLSLILVRAAAFDTASARDLTAEVSRRLPPRCAGEEDLCVFEVAARAGGRPHVLASFHGDSDGRASGPFLAALLALAADGFAAHTLVLGIDANTAHPRPAPPEAPPLPAPTLGAGGCGMRACGAPVGDAAGGGGGGMGGAGGVCAEGFRAGLAARGLASCWGAGDLSLLWTTFSARTFLQPQLHKAVGPAEAADPRHRRLRDWAVFRAAQLAPAGPAARDNTGRRALVPARTVPSAAFPSDHVIVAVDLAYAT